MRISLIIILILISFRSSIAREEINVDVEGSVVYILNSGVYANCCADFTSDLLIENDRLVITQTNISDEKCRCRCEFNLDYRLEGLGRGIYTVAIYRDEDDSVYYVGSVEFEVRSGRTKLPLGLDFEQSDCLINTTVDYSNFNYTSEIKVYPNPAQSDVTIQFDLLQPADVKIQIFNFLGKEVSTINKRDLKDGRHMINVDAKYLPSGMYIGKLITSTGDVRSFRIVWSK